LVEWVAEQFKRVLSRETVRRALKRLGLSWKKGKKLLSRADPEQRQAFVERIKELLAQATSSDDQLLVYIDEAHVHQDADLGYGWSKRGRRLWVPSTSPGLSAKTSFYGLYLYNEGQVRIWDYARANGEHTIDVLDRLRQAYPERRLQVVWDGAPYHRSAAVVDAGARLDIEIIRLPSYSPDFMPVEALWRWLRQEVTANYCHDTREELCARVAAFVERINTNQDRVADRLWVKDHLVLEEELLRCRPLGPCASAALGVRAAPNTAGTLLGTG